MSEGLKDILSNLNKDIEQDKLIEYLSNHMSETERHAFEKQMNDDDFMNDAVEGLQSIEQHKIPLVIEQLNTGLKKQLEKKKKKKEKRKIPDQSWVYYTIIMLLILAVIAYIVIKKSV